MESAVDEINGQEKLALKGRAIRCAQKGGRKCEKSDGARCRCRWHQPTEGGGERTSKKRVTVSQGEEERERKKEKKGKMGRGSIDGVGGEKKKVATRKEVSCSVSEKRKRREKDT